MYETTLHKLARHGIKVGSVALDLDTMLKRKDKVVSELTGGVGFLFKKYKVDPVFGAAKLLGGGKVEVTAADGKKTVLEAKNVLLATGSESVELPFLKFDGKHIVSSTEALNFNPVPKHLIVVGGGYIGLELGSVWKRLGSKVTVLEFLPRILAISDGEISTEVHKLLTKQGIEFHLETKVTGAKVKGDKVTVTAQGKDGKELSFTGDRVLVAVGRRPYTAGLGLDEAGVKYDAEERPRRGGRALPDERAAGVYAIGDLIAGPMLAHKASEEGIVLRRATRGHEAARELRRDPERHLHLAGGGERRPDGGAVEGEGNRVSRRQVPVRGQRPGEGDGRDRRLGEGAGRREDRPRARRPHPRPAGVRADRRVRDDHGVQGQRRGHRPLHARPPDAERSRRRSGAGRVGGDADQFVTWDAAVSAACASLCGRDRLRSQ